MTSGSCGNHGMGPRIMFRMGWIMNTTLYQCVSDASFVKFLQEGHQPLANPMASSTARMTPMMLSPAMQPEAIGMV